MPLKNGGSACFRAVQDMRDMAVLDKRILEIRKPTRIAKQG